MLNKQKLKQFGSNVGKGMTKFAQLKWVQVIKDSALVQMPFMLIGSIFLITEAIAQMSIDGYGDSALGRSMFHTIMNMGNSLSFGLASLITAFSLGYFASKMTGPTKMKMIPVNAGLLSMILFIVLTSVVAYVPAAGTALGKYTWHMDTGFFNPRGFFTAIIAGVVSHYIMYLFYKHAIGIRLPKSVPEFVVNAFNVVLTGVVVVMFGVILVNLLGLADTSMNKVMQKAFDFLTDIGASWGGMYVTAFFIMLAWFFGIHGGVTVQSIVAPTWGNALASNQAGAHNIFTNGFKDYYMNAGGLASILALAILFALFARSKRLKAIGTSSLIPGFFNISEPMVFGTPLIYNPYTAVPFFLIPMVNITIGGLFSTNEWFADVQTIQVHWAIPAPIQAYLATLSWQAVLVSLLCMTTAGLIWFPFFKRYDAIIVAEEAAGQKTAATLAAEEKARGFKQQKAELKRVIAAKSNQSGAAKVDNSDLKAKLQAKLKNKK